MRSKLVLLSLLMVLVIGVGTNTQYQDLPLSTKEGFIPETIVGIDNVTIYYSNMCVILQVGYTRNGSAFSLNSLGWTVELLLSLDNVSWRTVEKHQFDLPDVAANVTRFFRIANHWLSPFPFDVEKNEVLYCCLEFHYLGEDEAHYPEEPFPTYRTSSIAVISPVSITRAWYFTFNWRIGGILSVIPMTLFVVFLVSRQSRISHSRRLKTGVD